MTNKDVVTILNLNVDYEYLMDFQGYQNTLTGVYGREHLQEIEDILEKHLSKPDFAKIAAHIKILDECIDIVHGIIEAKINNLRMYGVIERFPSGGIISNNLCTYPGQNGEEYVLVKNRKSFEDDELY